MKTHRTHRPQGFTLVELLVVIAIIAVLAGAGFVAGNSAIQKAKKVTCLATAHGIEGAVNTFYTEYGSMPKAALTADTTIDAQPGLIDLVNVLLGTEPVGGAAILNARKIKFLAIKEGKARKNGIIYSAASNTVDGLYDPWGGTYSVILDGNYDEIVAPATKASPAVTLNGRRVAVWSNGADGVVGGAGTATDDVKTW